MVDAPEYHKNRLRQAHIEAALRRGVPGPPLEASPERLDSDRTDHFDFTTGGGTMYPPLFILRKILLALKTRFS